MGLEHIKRKIKTTADLLSVVKTMKSLASVNIRQYEKAVHSLEDYSRTVELAWLALFTMGGGFPRLPQEGPAVILALGSDQGMAGQFNDVLLERAKLAADELANHSQVNFWVSGERVRAGLLDENRPLGEVFELPSSLVGIEAAALHIIDVIAAWRKERGVHRFYVLYNQPQRGGSYQPTLRKLLPLDEDWAGQFAQKTWPERNLPMLGLSAGDLFDRLFGQYLFIALYQAFCLSLTSENAARLAAMQAAEKNIEELQGDLQAEFRQTRQTVITGELLDVVSGFEAMSGG